jgi:hypothetical protein
VLASLDENVPPVICTVALARWSPSVSVMVGAPDSTVVAAACCSFMAVAVPATDRATRSVKVIPSILAPVPAPNAGEGVIVRIRLAAVPAPFSWKT